MNKIFLFVILLFSHLATVEGLDVQGRVAYFIPQDHHIRSIYSDGLPEYEVEIAAPLNSCSCLCECNDDLTGWANFSIYQKKGHSIGCSDFRYATKVTNWALNFGLKRYFSGCLPCFFDNLRPYLGLGIGVARVKFHDHSPYVRNHVEKYGFALLAKLGFEYQITCNLFLDLFADYSGNWFDSPSSNSCNSTRCINTGGLKLGAGLGYRF